MLLKGNKDDDQISEIIEIGYQFYQTGKPRQNDFENFVHLIKMEKRRKKSKPN